jgi:urease accessory protein
MLVVRDILGRADEPRFAGRRVERLAVDSAAAAKRRLRGTTDCGTDVAVDVERGAYLADGAVLDDDGARIVIVERSPEEAFVIRLAPGLPREELVRQALRLGHAFGNQHVPVELEGEEIRGPVTTSREVVADTVHALVLDGAELDFASVPLARERALTSSAHHHG